MKFTQIAAGQQFEYQGKLYTRSGPLMATDAEGNTRMIPRSADVTPIGAITQPKVTISNKPISTEQAIKAFDDCQAQLEQCLQSAQPLDKGQIQACLRAAKDRFLQILQ